MSDRLRCCQCSKGATWRRLEGTPWLSVMDPDGSNYMYCHECGPGALDEWAPEAIRAAEHGHGFFFSVLFARGERLVSRPLEFEFERLSEGDWAHA